MNNLERDTSISFMRNKCWDPSLLLFQMAILPLLCSFVSALDKGRGGAQNWLD